MHAAQLSSHAIKFVRYHIELVKVLVEMSGGHGDEGDGNGNGVGADDDDEEEEEEKGEDEDADEDEHQDEDDMTSMTMTTMAMTTATVTTTMLLRLKPQWWLLTFNLSSSNIRALSALSMRVLFTRPVLTSGRHHRSVGAYEMLPKPRPLSKYSIQYRSCARTCRLLPVISLGILFYFHYNITIRKKYHSY